MRVELFIYIYGAICISMIAFNCVCIFMFKRSNTRLDHRSRKLEQRVRIQLERIANEEEVEKKHFCYLNRKLSHVGNLMAFDETLKQIFQNNENEAKQYLYEIRSVFLYLSVVYLKKESVQSAYFAYLLSKYKICSHMSFDAMLDILKEYLKKESLYCRQNAMKALYSFGDEEHVVEGIKVLEQSHIFFHSKILSDGLLEFEADHDKLIALLWQSFDKFFVETQVAILNYIRFRTGDYCENMLEILKDKNRNQELHYAAIRYFGKYHYPPALPILLEFASDTDSLHWNYAAFSASALAIYPGEKTSEVLKKSLMSSNWYVRYNAAQSIDLLGTSYFDLMDIMNGDDRYAREMMNYRFDRRQFNEEEAEVATVL